MPRLLGWGYTELPPDARKTFEVALHAGSAPALVLALRGDILRAPHLQALTVLPAAEPALDRPLEQQAGNGGGQDRQSCLLYTSDAADE